MTTDGCYKGFKALNETLASSPVLPLFLLHCQHPSANGFDTCNGPYIVHPSLPPITTPEMLEALSEGG